MIAKSIDDYTVDELKELRREINRKLRVSNRGCQTESKVATLRCTDAGTYLHRKEWQIVLSQIRLGYCIEQNNAGLQQSFNKVVLKGETKEQAINGIDTLIAELTELSKLAKQEVIE